MNDKKKTSGRPKNNSEPVVREVKVSDVAENDEDKKLIVVIAIAILIIIGTVIGLLVGCQKEETNDTNETNETENKTDIIVPISHDDDVDEDENNVVRTTSSTTTTKYQITYILDGEKVYSTNIASGKKISKYTPKGYEKCSYYGDSELTESFDFSKTPTDDTKVYLVCKIKEYTVTYKDSDGSEISSETLKGTDTEDYKVEGNGKENFLGWSKDGSKKIAYKAGEKIDVNDNLTLTAVYGATTVKYNSILVHPIRTEMDVDYGDEDEPPVVDEVISEEVTPEEVNESGDDNGGYSSNVEVIDSVEIGYTQEEVDNYTLPSDPSEVGLETPTYFVPVDEETDTSKRIVSDDTEEVGDRQVKLGDVEGRTPDWYTPAVDDNVEEKDCEFQGWSEPSDYKPSTSGNNSVDAIYTIPEEDQEPPAAPPATNTTSGGGEPEPQPEAPAEDANL